VPCVLTTPGYILHHLVSDYLSDLVTLPLSAIKQGKGVLLSALQGLASDVEDYQDSHRPRAAAISSDTASPQSLSSSPMSPISDEEEVLPLPPQLELPDMGYSPAPSEEPGRPILSGCPISDTLFPRTPMSATFIKCKRLYTHQYLTPHYYHQLVSLEHHQLG